MAALSRLPIDDLSEGGGEAFGVCPECDYHWYVSASERVTQMLDDGTFEEWYADLEPSDPLHFSDKKAYADRLKAEQKRTGMRDVAVVGCGMILAPRVAFGVTDSAFIMGSMGSVVGEKVTPLTERATVEQLPLIIIMLRGVGESMKEFLAHANGQGVGGACPIQSGRGGLFISVLTNPTMGGVAASFRIARRPRFCRAQSLNRLCRTADD